MDLKDLRHNEDVGFSRFLHLVKLRSENIFFNIRSDKWGYRLDIRMTISVSYIFEMKGYKAEISCHVFNVTLALTFLSSPMIV